MSIESSKKRMGRPRKIPVSSDPVEPQSAQDLIRSIQRDAPSASEQERESIRTHIRKATRSESRESTREPVRKHELSSLERAQMRSQEILKSGNLSQQNNDRTRTPPPPDGWEYEWKLHSVWNQEFQGHQTDTQMQGWTPVPASRHPQMVPVGYKGDTISLAGSGTVLYERPKYINDLKRKERDQIARDQINDKEAQMHRGSGRDRDFVQMRRPQLSNSYEPLSLTSEQRVALSVPNN